VVGVGTSSGAVPEGVRRLVEGTVARAGLAWASVATVATIDRRAGSPAVVGLGRPVASFPAERLARVGVPHPSPAVDAAVGTPSVAEAAALAGAGPGGRLVVAKQKGSEATVAVARRARPPGGVVLVGLGPGDGAHRTPAADSAVRRAEVVVGYGPYVDQAAPLLGPHHEVVRSPIGDERVRAKQALAEAAAGRRVAVVCSGDPGVYAMASLVCELAADEAPGVGLEVVPGVTAGLAAAAALGAPLGHDHVVVSLSDLLTPWDVIARRLRAAAEADLVTVLYNPASARRRWQLPAALDLLRARRPAATPVGVVADVARPGQSVHLTTLADVDVGTVGMTACVIVGSSTTRVVGGRMVTPRGYGP
jgi:cobalt-precorrin 5A hydrolase / precorrin-3B C17-methyltransferase